MPQLGIDFGTSNTVIARWDPERQEGVPIDVEEYGRPVRYRLGADEGERISVVPSQVHYSSDGRHWIGQQVADKNLGDSPRTFRWMKRYIARRNPLKLKVDGLEISARDAGVEFLSAVLAAVQSDLDSHNLEAAVSVPVEAFEDYEDWLTDVVESAGLPRVRVIDEPSAAALGYGISLEEGMPYLVFDFGGGTLDVAVVLAEEQSGPGIERRCRVLGKAGADLGGAKLDQWLFEEVLRQNQCTDSDEDIVRLSRRLLDACEQLKEQLSVKDQAAMEIADPKGGRKLSVSLDRAGFERLLEKHEAYHRMEHTIRRALSEAHSRGYGEDHLRAILLVGGSCMIPSVQRTVQRFFGRERVQFQRPLDAVARGAAAFAAGVALRDYIQHDYALRFLDPKKDEYSYRPLVARGTPYPSREPVARLTIKASHDGQLELGVAIFELGEPRQRGAAAPVELVFDPTGAARLSYVSAEEEERRYYFWVNEKSPTFLRALAPVKKGEARFEVEFSIDSNKRLLLTARDLKSRRVTHRDFPVVKLT